VRLIQKKIQKNGTKKLFGKKSFSGAHPGLPDGFTPKILFRVNFEGLVLEDVGIFYGYLVHFTANW
jgi:hypothetical protein